MSETTRVFNFNAGPAILPAEVMRQAQQEFVDFRGKGYGIMEASHRSSMFADVAAQAEADMRQLLNISDDYAVLFLQGGASLQFSMCPMNLMLGNAPAAYADTGSWTSSAIKEARLLGDVEILYSGKATNYSEIGDYSQWQVPANASYMYLCSNNTIFGTQYRSFPETGAVPLVADMSSDILSRRFDVNKFGLIFAGAQKNLGPSGVTLVIIRKDLASRVKATVPTMLKYSTHIEAESMYNTPPTFAIYMVGLVLQWLKKLGGLDAIEQINNTKSHHLYECIDQSSFYVGTAEPADRSKMNVCFRLAKEELESVFLKDAEAAGLIGLKGHRSVGGVRASIYNAMPLQGVERLIDFMHDFEKQHA